MEQFFQLMDQQPPWLGGIVFGPQVRVNLPELRQRIPKRYPIRFYPDITHSVNAEFTVNDWDVAYAQTEEREGINPRPLDEARIFGVLQPFADVGFLTYSEGCNDDVNKAIWSALGWNPQANVTDVLRDYARYFIGPDMADAFAQGLLALERNWRGPLLTNSAVDVTLAQFQDLERRASPQQKASWRFQQSLYRAYYDAYLRVRLSDESARERRAMELLATARAGNTLPAISAAETALAVDPLAGAGSELRARVFELAEALFQSIRMQLSVPRYAAIDAGRGANLDLIDRPITNADWLRKRFADIRMLDGDAARRAAIDEILNWTNPGPGGFYDDLGDPVNRPHLEPGVGFERDPAFFHTARTGFGCTVWQFHPAAVHGTGSLGALQGALHAGRRRHSARHSPRRKRQVRNPSDAQEGARSEAAGIRYPGGGDSRRQSDARVAAQPRGVRKWSICAGFRGVVAPGKVTFSWRPRSAPSPPRKSSWFRFHPRFTSERT